MLKETKTEETIVFFCDIFIIGSILIGGGAGSLGLPLATPMLHRILEVHVNSLPSKNG